MSSGKAPGPPPGLLPALPANTLGEQRRIIGPGFREQVYAVVKRVPAGAVSTYGDVGSALGSPRVARQVGFALAALSHTRDDVPWHRIINAKGCISFRGDDERGILQRARLEAEGIEFSGSGGGGGGAAEKVVDFARLRFVHALPSDEL